MEENFFGFSRQESKGKKALIALSVLGVVCVVGAFAVFSPSNPLAPIKTVSQDEIEELEFQNFMARHNKHYEADEYQTRFKIYRDNTAFIRVYNQRNLNWYLGVNEFADMTFEEFKQIYTPTKFDLDRPRNPQPVANLEVPSSVDWRKKGAVTQVKNQGQCGSCWSFSTTGSVEGAWFLAGNDLVSLSEQELVDCSVSYGNRGCQGGFMDYAFKYIIANGITSEKNYPYDAKQGECQQDKVKDVVAKISNYTDVKPEDPQSLMAAVSQQPVSVAVEADQWVWQFYFGGVVDNYCGTNLDHGVLIVGYDNSATPPYYIVKNSWGPGWGIDGYIKIGIKDGKGVCGIQVTPSYPTV